MPTGNWTKLQKTQEEARNIIRDWQADSEYGWAFVVDHWVPQSKHDDVDLAPFARVTVSIEELSPDQQKIAEMLTPVMGERIAPSLSLHKDVMLDVSVLQLYQQIGVEFVVKQVWRYDQSFVFRDWVMAIFEKRAESTDEVERDCLKLLLNGVFGKTLEDRTKRKASSFYTDKEKWLRAAAHPISDFMLVRQEPFLGLASKPQRKATALDTPRYVGWCILQRSKAHMYRFWYDTIKPVFNRRAQLLYMDTDSFLMKLESDRVEEELAECNKAKINLNGKQLGMFKDEAESYRKKYGPGQFVAYIGLAAKLYSILFENGINKVSVMKARGVPKHTLTSFDQYLDFNQNPTPHTLNFAKLVRRRQSISLQQLTRRGVAGLDTKTYWAEQSYPLGHYKITLKQCFDAWRVSAAKGR
jgi:hypothetical protein